MNYNLIRKVSLERIRNVFKEWHINLPNIEQIANIRDKKEVCDRINCLHILYTIGSEPDNIKIYLKILKEQGEVSLTNSEIEILKLGKRIPEKNLMDFQWNKEAIKMLLWCISLVKSVEFPFTEDFLSNYYHLMPPEISNNEFLKLAKNKNLIELVQEVDFLYCYHWGLKHLYDFEDKHIQISIVRERRLALEWLIRPDQQWDEILLDT